MRAGCYTLDLYCDNRLGTDAPCYRDAFPKVFVHEKGSVCRRKARRAGWRLGIEQDLCPKCSGKAPAQPYALVKVRPPRKGTEVACFKCGRGDCTCDPPR